MGNRSKEQKTNRKYRCAFRLNDDEYRQLKGKLSTTCCRKVSDYVRNVLFEKPITVKYRDQSIDDFMNELIRLRAELNALGNNFNQVVKKLNSITPSPQYKIWLSISTGMQNELLEKVGNIQKRINDFSGEWLSVKHNCVSRN